MIGAYLPRMAYIDAEMAKLRGQREAAADKGEALDAFDPQAELEKIIVKYNSGQPTRKDDEEGHVTNSMGMLTSIPEVDLGMESVVLGSRITI